MGRWTLHALVLGVLAAMSLPAQGQSTAEAPDEPSAERAGPAGDEAELDTVTVTAIRRERDIDTVPVAVTAVDGDDLVSLGIQDTQNLQAVAPSLIVTVSGSEAAGSVVRIRGIGTTGGNPGLEPAVGVFVDGVYRARSGIALNDLFDTDQVEVLRGPQGTLFGKNTSAGAISISTRAPEFVPGIDVWASAGDRSAWRLGTAITGGVIEDLLALRLSAQTQRKDGFIDNAYDGGEYNDRDRFQLRAQALLTPNESLRLRLIGDYSEKDERCCAAPYSYNGPASAVIAALGGTVFEPVREYDVAFDRQLRGQYEERGLSTHLDWRLGEVDFNAILSYRDWESDNRADADYSDLDLSYFPQDEYSNLYRSAEFSFKGTHGRLDWLVGAFYGRDEMGVDGRLLLGEDAGRYFSALTGGLVPASVYPAGTGHQRRQFRQDGTAWSLFTHDIVDLGAGFDLTAGLRYTDESKTGRGVVEANSPSCVLPGIPAALRVLCGAPPYAADYDDDRLLGTLGLSKTFDNALMLYLSYAQGFKAGGINLDPTASLSASLEFKPETVDTWELGLKHAFADGRLRARLAAFHSKFEDYQLNAFDGLGFTISNEASVTARGVEMEADYTFLDHWRLSGGLTYNHATFGDDSTAALRGRQVTNAPRWSGTLGLFFDHRLPFLPAAFFASANVRSQSEVNTSASLTPFAHQGGYTLINARAGLRFDNQWEVALWSNNLTDKFYRTIIFASVAQTGSFNGYAGEPRTVGVEVRKSF